MLFSFYYILKIAKCQKKSYSNIDEIIDYVTNNESNDTESDIDLGESDYEREISDSDILEDESEDIANEPGILINTSTVVTENSDNEQEFQVFCSFATEDVHYEPVHHPQPTASTSVSNSNPLPQPLAEVTLSYNQ